MQSHDVVPRPSSAPEPVVGVEQAEAALVEHYPRLVRLAHLLLPPGLGRSRRVLTAHALAQRALPRGRASRPVIPAQSAGAAADHGYAVLRVRVVRAALRAGRGGRVARWLRRLPPPLPQVWGLKLFPRSGGADELALDQRLGALSGPARAAYVLRGLEGLADDEVRRVLSAAGVTDPRAALREAERVPAQYPLLHAPEFDPCLLQARPTDLLRRRQHTKAALAAAAALAVCGALVALPGTGWGPNGAAAPSSARNPSAEAALDPAKLTRVPATAWRTSARLDFSVWPARGGLTRDTALLRRALAVWARPGASVRVTATPGTASGGPAGPPQLLYAGEVDNARVVILYDGLRIVRYTEPKGSTAGAALDFARVDGAAGATASAVVLDRSDTDVRYLTAPWVRRAAARDLLDPSSDAPVLALRDGVTEPLSSPAARSGPCTSWNVLELTGDGGARLLTDLGELVPAQLTAGRPADPLETADPQLLHAWAPYACALGEVRAQGVRSVNTWRYAEQPLPDGSGFAAWACTRADTWRGTAPRVLAQFLTPGGTTGAVTARDEGVPACGARSPHVLAGVLWKSRQGDWYLLAAGDEDTASIATTGGIEASAEGRLLTVRARQGVTAELKGTLRDGSPVRGLS